MYAVQMLSTMIHTHSWFWMAFSWHPPGWGKPANMVQAGQRETRKTEFSETGRKFTLPPNKGKKIHNKSLAPEKATGNICVF